MKDVNEANPSPENHWRQNFPPADWLGETTMNASSIAPLLPLEDMPLEVNFL
jgi:hypothetical protein